MIQQGKKTPRPIFAKLANLPGFASFYKRVSPNMHFGNQPDMTTITTDRLWFLRENRFLFLTRDGPIEITLKPSFVLTGILVCMAGIAAIFYSTLIASYSAIEVMRDETIQQAEASSSAKRTDLDTAKLITWEGYQPSTSLEQHSPGVNGKDKKPSRVVSDQISTNANTLSGQASQYGRNLDGFTNEYLPMIIQGGKRVTLADEKNDARSETPSVALSSRDITAASIGTPLTLDSGEALENVIGSTDTNKAVATRKITGEPHIPADATPEAPPKPDTEVLAEISKATSQTVEQVTTKRQTETSGFGTRAQEFAVALLPSFATKPNSIRPKADAERVEESRKHEEIAQGLKLNGMPSITPDDGLSTNKKNTQSGPVLPVVNEATRLRKMLLTYTREIDYIRSTVTGLGISQEVLPAPLFLNSQKSGQVKDKEFKSLMIKLAEHRAALRKIPFKPPMLYFYISSGYGMRKHPKTGKKTFHHGIDLAGTWQENVRATAPGRIIYAGSEGAFGKVVRVQHAFGVVTTYAHLARITVRHGDYVSESQVVGKMGSTGRSVGAHLHYEIRVNGKSINPNKFLKVGRQISVAGELRQSAFVE